MANISMVAAAHICCFASIVFLSFVTGELISDSSPRLYGISDKNVKELYRVNEFKVEDGRRNDRRRVFQERHNNLRTDDDGFRVERKTFKITREFSRSSNMIRMGESRTRDTTRNRIRYADQSMSRLSGERRENFDTLGNNRKLVDTLRNRRTNERRIVSNRENSETLRESRNYRDSRFTDERLMRERRNRFNEQRISQNARDSRINDNRLDRRVVGVSTTEERTSRTERRFRATEARSNIREIQDGRRIRRVRSDERLAHEDARESVRVFRKALDVRTTEIFSREAGNAERMRRETRQNERRIAERASREVRETREVRHTERLMPEVRNIKSNERSVRKARDVRNTEQRTNREAREARNLLRLSRGDAAVTGREGLSRRTHQETIRNAERISRGASAVKGERLTRERKERETRFSREVREIMDAGKRLSRETRQNSREIRYSDEIRALTREVDRMRISERRTARNFPARNSNQNRVNDFIRENGERYRRSVREERSKGRQSVRNFERPLTHREGRRLEVRSRPEILDNRNRILSSRNRELGATFSRRTQTTRDTRQTTMYKLKVNRNIEKRNNNEEKQRIKNAENSQPNVSYLLHQKTDTTCSEVKKETAFNNTNLKERIENPYDSEMERYRKQSENKSGLNIFQKLLVDEKQKPDFKLIPTDLTKAISLGLKYISSWSSSYEIPEKIPLATQTSTCSFPHWQDQYSDTMKDAELETRLPSITSSVLTGCLGLFLMTSHQRKAVF